MGVFSIPRLLLAVSFAVAQLAAAQVAPGTQAPSSAATAAPAHPASARAAAAPASRGAKGALVARAATRPLWRELAGGQQQALAPLAGHWDTLSVAQKRKWIALSANFPKMSAEEQAKLHSRMTEWVSLSPQQRTIARLNYGAARKISADDKKAKWEAYQALPAEEKKKLAAKAVKPPAFAAALKPPVAEKLATEPKAPERRAAKTPRIAAAPNQVDHNTLLPQQAPIPLPPQAGTPD